MPRGRSPRRRATGARALSPVAPGAVFLQASGRWPPRVALVLLMLGALALSRSAEGYTSFVLATVAINVAVGVGLNILLGLSGQVSFGHVGFFAIGAYVAGISMQAGLPFWLVFPAAGAVTAAVGAALAIPSLRVAGPYLAMMTIAFAFIVEHGTIEWREVTGGANGLMVFESPVLFGRTLDERDLATVAVLLAGLALALFLRLSRGAWGLAMRAVRDSEIASRSLGLNPLTVKAMSFVLSAVLTGLAGAMFTPLNGFISPGSFPFFQSILFILAVVVGGAGTLLGPVVGACIVVLLPEVLSGMAEYRLLVFGGLLLGVLWLAPRGVTGSLARLALREDPRPARASGRDLATVLGYRETRAEPLTVTGLGRAFGGVRAAEDVAFTAEPGHVTSLIGPNGAGKTTVLNLIGGFYRPDTGTIALGARLSGLPAHRVARAGVSRTYQTTRLFDQLSVLENVLVGARRGRLGLLLAPAATRAEVQVAEDLLDFVGYRGPLARPAGQLAHVDRRLVEIARALASRPRVLLLDEPAAGLSRDDKARLAALVREIAGLGVVVVLVEHDMALVMEISDHVVVLDAGRLLLDGTPQAVRASDAVRRAYLGGTEFAGRPRAAARAGHGEPVLATDGLTAGYGAAPALADAHVRVLPGETVTVLGANGAGKSTFLRAVSGLHRPVDGAVVLDGDDVAARPAHAIVRAGLSLVPEGRQVFPELTALDNILLGAHGRGGQVDRAALDRLLDRFPRLKERLAAKAGVLSGGEQQMLALARGLVAEPKILLLDEPSLGLAPSMIGELYDVLADLRDEGTTILIVDQMANLALTVADRGYVLAGGRVVHDGPCAELRDDPAIERAYLGESG